MKKKNTLKPARGKFSILRQICNLIPAHEVSKIARQTGVEDESRTFSPWSHTVSLLNAQRTHGLGLNGPIESDFELLLKLAVISFEQSLEGQVLIQVRPMKTEWRNLNMIQLWVRASRQTGIFRRWKTNLRAAFHANDDPAIHMGGGASSLSQIIHA
jgi:hypothetical protein